MMCNFRFFTFKCHAILVALLCLSPALLAQTYNFSQFNIEEGLVQSQVLKISQDRSRYLWFATYGGLSRFDGKEFVSFTKSDGLTNNMVTAILNDSKGRTWAGSEGGLVRIDGRKLSRIATPGNGSGASVRAIVEDESGKIWLTRKYQLLAFSNGKVVPSPITQNDQYVTALTKSPSGQLYAAVYAKGIYCLKNGKWQKQVGLADSLSIIKIAFDRTNPGNYYLLSSYNHIYSVLNGVLKPYSNPVLMAASEGFSTMELDAKGNLWVGSSTGAYRVAESGTEHFTASNGFSNSQVDDIFMDAEENIWLGTNGTGVYRFDGDGFMSFNKINGSAHIVMSMSQDSLKNIWMGTINNGLIKFDGKSFTNVPVPSKYSNTVYSIYTRPGQNMLVGTTNGLWEHNGRTFRNLLEGFSYPRIVYSVLKDRKGVIWMAAPKGFFYLQHGKVGRVEGLDYSSSTQLELGSDSLLVATNNGIYLLKDKKLDKSFLVKGLSGSSVVCMVRYKDLIIAGTFGDGLFLIDLKTKRTRQFNTRQGLYSNDIYSLAIDERATIWAGTGRGVNQFAIDREAFSVRMISNGNQKALIECNQNAILVSAGKVWFGSTKGLYIYNAESQGEDQKKPFIDIQSLTIMSQQPGKKQSQITYSGNIPRFLKLKHVQNRLVFSFRGIYLSNPDEVSYRYRLQGSDEEFQDTKLDLVEYPALLPGTYTFEVLAVNGRGLTSNSSIVTFTIDPPFYETIWFRVLAILLITAFIIGVQYYWNYRKEKNKQLLEEIKKEEQMKIRRQTAEDFHDDIGNKLTRIAVLSDILNKQLGEGNKEQKNLVEQIKGNAATLYSGTKDILWALDPQSDNLFEILNYVNAFGTELFHATGIEFSFEDPDPKYQKLQLPMEYSRNISMILKESFHNCLKHAEAKNVSIRTSAEKEGIKITVSDDGKGFNPDALSKGRGLNNIRMRAKRINGTIKILSTPGTPGSKMELLIQLENI